MAVSYMMHDDINAYSVELVWARRPTIVKSWVRHPLAASGTVSIGSGPCY